MGSYKYFKHVSTCFFFRCCSQAYITLIATLLYTVEAGLKIIAFGLILHPKAYLRSVVHILDVFIILFG